MFSFLASISIYFLNLSITLIMKKVIVYEGRATNTSYNLALGKRLSLALFINSGIVSIISKVVIFGSSEAYGNMYGDSGLVQQQTFVFLSIIILPFIINLVNPFHKIKYIQRYIEI